MLQGRRWCISMVIFSDDICSNFSATLKDEVCHYIKEKGVWKEWEYEKKCKIKFVFRNIPSYWQAEGFRHHISTSSLHFPPFPCRSWPGCPVKKTHSECIIREWCRIYKTYYLDTIRKTLSDCKHSIKSKCSMYLK